VPAIAANVLRGDGAVLVGEGAVPRQEMVARLVFDCVSGHLDFLFVHAIIIVTVVLWYRFFLEHEDCTCVIFITVESILAFDDLFSFFFLILLFIIIVDYDRHSLR
jgi:hypothetical protein